MKKEHTISYNKQILREGYDRPITSCSSRSCRVSPLPPAVNTDAVNTPLQQADLPGWGRCFSKPRPVLFSPTTQRHLGSTVGTPQPPCTNASESHWSPLGCLFCGPYGRRMRICKARTAQRSGRGRGFEALRFKAREAAKHGDRYENLWSPQPRRSMYAIYAYIDS